MVLPQVEITNNNDGTWTATSESGAIIFLEDDLVNILGGTVNFLDEGTFTISSTELSNRLRLQILLVTLLGSSNVYFQPPPTIKMEYPCIVYKRDRIRTNFANNKPYKHKKRYQVTVMDRDPDSVIHEKVAALPMCSYDRFYTADNLNHDVYNLFF